VSHVLSLSLTAMHLCHLSSFLFPPLFAFNRDVLSFLFCFSFFIYYPVAFMFTSRIRSTAAFSSRM
jgi:hypothetical protein